MRIVILAVGRIKPGPERSLFDHYAGRIAAPLRVVEIEAKRTVTAEERIRREAVLLAAAIPARARLVALDPKGEMLTSAELALRIGRFRDSGAAALAFLIGGADGLERALLAQADLVLAFGRATWPHFLVRAMLAEQIYRAETIRAGHPYHRGG